MPVEIRNVLRVEDPNGVVYYLGTFSARQIKELTFVPVVALSPTAEEPLSLEERSDSGYQRAGEPRRMQQIKEFLVENPRYMMPPVLLSARGQWSWEPNKAGGTLGSLTANDLAAVIDGQHRLGGLWRLACDENASDEQRSRPIPFMLIDDVSIDEERFDFIYVNDTQKGVKKSLLRYLERDSDLSGQAAYALMEAEDSVFCGRISIQRKEDWTLLLFGAMRDCILETYNKDFMAVTRFRPGESQDTATRAIEFLIQYWRLVSTELPLFWSDMMKMPPVNGTKSAAHPGTRKFEYRLLEETGIRAMSRLGSDILRAAWMNTSQSPGWDKVTQLLGRIQDDEQARLALTKPSVDPRVLQLDPELKSTGKAGVNAIYRYLRQATLGGL
jgi:DGQHR domain-containing protein